MKSNILIFKVCSSLFIFLFSLELSSLYSFPSNAIPLVQGQIGLSQNEKDRIYLEEVYRQQVKDSISKKNSSNKIVEFFNTPLGLYLLSSVFIGMLSFMYARWSEAKEVRRINEEIVSDLIGEARFRIRQIDLAIDKANRIGELCFQELENGDIKRKSVSNYIVLAGGITACIKLGGIINFPSPIDQAQTIKIGINEYSNNNLPYGRGYKSEKYLNDDLLDLVTQLLMIKPQKFKKKSTLGISFKNALIGLEEVSDFSNLEDVYRDWLERSRGLGEYKNHDRNLLQFDLSDCDDKLHKVHEWITRVDLTWKELKQHPLMLEFHSI